MLYPFNVRCPPADKDMFNSKSSKGGASKSHMPQCVTGDANGNDLVGHHDGMQSREDFIIAAGKEKER